MKKDEQLGVSRRSFLKGAGLAAAAMAGTAALAGCANESAGGADTLANTGDWLPQTWDYECDLLVIGYGGAGMWASLIGADECGPAGARAGEGSRARWRKQLHQQRRVDHCGGVREGALQGLHPRLH